MKKIIRFSWAYALVGVSLCSILFSFSHIIGAHNFQVFLDDKMIADQYVDSKSIIPTLRIDPSDNNSQLIIKYNECGRTVSGRAIIIKGDKNQVLKDWRFEGATSGYKDPMTCPVKDIVALKQKGINTLKLFYSSKEFPEGQQIANLNIVGEAKTALN
ncbi:MAG TPA: hypothetical protein VEW65_01775 [Chryseolinea sp.]|nr:hypothetical protein [Chryseolinea sp.]